MIKKLKIVAEDMKKTVITNISGNLGRKIRYWYWSKRFKRCGENVFIDEGVIIQNPQWISVGDNVWIDKYVILIAGKPDDKKSSKIFTKKSNPYFSGVEGELIIGNYVHIAPHCTIQAHGGVYIGNNVGIASGSRVYSLSHHYKNLTNPDDKYEYKFTPMADFTEQSLISAPVVIDDNCAIGLNCVVLPGTTVQKGTWIGVSSYISGVVKGNAVYVSQQAHFLKEKC